MFESIAVLTAVFAMGVGPKALLDILGLIVISAGGIGLVMWVFPKIFEKGKLGWLKVIIFFVYLGGMIPLFYFVYVPFLAGL